MGANTTTTTGATQNQVASVPYSSTTTRSPWDAAQPFLQGAMQQASDIYNQSTPFANAPTAINPNQNPYVATPSEWTNQGLYQNIDFANAARDSGLATNPFFWAAQRFQNPIDSQTQGFINQYQNLYQNAANNYATPLSWTQNLYNQAQSPLAAETNLQGLAANTSGALTPTQQAILDQNAERLGNRLASQYSGAGRYGSFGAGIGLARGISETNNPLIAQFNQQAIQNALAANQQLTGATMGRYGLQGTAAQGYGGLLGQQLGQEMAATAGGAGVYNQAQARAQQYGAMLPGLFQLGLAPGQAMQNAGNYMLSYPWRNLGTSISALSGLAPIIGNAGTIQTAGLQPMSVGGTSTQTASQPTPWTTYAGLGLAGLGALSDRRLKTDIKKMGTDPWTKLPIYAYRYKGDPKSYPKVMGPMAQDVQKKYPDKVGSVGGLLYIKG